MAPRVSVLMATYNDGPTLRAAIESVLHQTFSDFEFIIVDDGSTDSTAYILDSYDDKRIIRLRNKTNYKLAFSLNRGLEVARGDLIARMDSDDISTPDRLEKQVCFMGQHKEIGILGTQYDWVNKAGQVAYRSSHPLTHGLITWQYLSRHAYPLRHGTIMARRDLFEQHGGYNTDFPREQDGELFLRLIHTVRYANLPESLYLARGQRSAGAASRVFAISFPFTLEIRRQCIAKLLDREVSLEEIQGVIVPQKREHRQACGVTLTKSSVERGVGLLVELLWALEKRGYLTAVELHEATAEMGSLVANMFSQSDEFFLKGAETKPLSVLVEPLVRKVMHRKNSIRMRHLSINEHFFHN